MRKPNHTQVSNDFIDLHMRDLSGAAVKVCLVIFRQTIGWHKDTDPVSVSQLVQKTGLSDRHVSRAVQELEAAHLITAERSPGQTTVYGLAFEDATPDKMSGVPLTKGAVPPPTKGNTQKKELKKQKKKGEGEHVLASSESPRPELVSASELPPSPSSLSLSEEKEAQREKSHPGTSLLSSMKRAAVSRNIPLSFLSVPVKSMKDPSWGEGKAHTIPLIIFAQSIRELQSEGRASEGNILRAWSHCLETNAGKAAHFAEDYSKYCRQLNDAVLKEAAARKAHEGWHSDICPGCHIGGGWHPDTCPVKYPQTVGATA